MDFCFGTFRLQTAEKSRGWLEIRRFLDQTNRLGATYFWKNFRTNETYEKFSKNSKNFQKNFSKNFSKIFRSFSKTFRLFRDFENFSRNRSRRDDSFGPKIVEFRAILAIFWPFEDLDVRPDVQRCRN